jgi:Zn-dependent metalloprotease
LNQYNVPRRIFGIKPSADVQKRSDAARAAKGGGVEVLASNFLKTIEKNLKISVDPAQLRFDKVKRSPLGRHVLFQQYYDGKPVSNGWVRVDVDKDDHIYNVQNDTVPLDVVAKVARAKTASPPLPDRAIQIAFAESGADQSKTKEVLESQLVYFPYQGQPRLAWKVMVRGSEPALEWKLYVDAETSEVLEKIDLLRHVQGKATVFDPNPVVSLNDTTLTDTSPIPPGAYRAVELNELSGTGFIDGKFASTRRTASRVHRPTHDFSLQRHEPGFKEAMVYYHIDRVQRYLQELGFDNILNGPIEVDADGIPDDNSFYQPSTKALTFGTGGVDDAEDADIILHEYGHAIQDAQVPGWGASPEARAMGEGFGDYLAASFFESQKQDGLKACVGTWDAVVYSDDNPRCLRRVDSRKKYPQDLRHEEHDDGEIWSAFLWDLRARIGDPKRADQLVIAHHFLLSRTASFADAANALLTADEQLNAGEHGSHIRDLARARGFSP